LQNRFKNNNLKNYKNKKNYLGFLFLYFESFFEINSIKYIRYNNVGENSFVIEKNEEFKRFLKSLEIPEKVKKIKFSLNKSSYINYKKFLITTNRILENIFLQSSYLFRSKDLKLDLISILYLNKKFQKNLFFINAQEFLKIFDWNVDINLFLWSKNYKSLKKILKKKNKNLIKKIIKFPIKNEFGSKKKKKRILF
jgi:hypothetical protein